MQIEWNRPKDQVLETGLDRGVIYVEDGPAVPWNGLISVDDDGKSSTKEFYLDGVKFLVMVTPRDYKGTINAYSYPEEFGELIGYGELGDGFYADGQPPGRFDLSYRTMVGSPGYDDRQHYKIHLIFSALASLGGFTHETLTSDAADPTDFTFDIEAVPQRIPNMRPSAHLIVDTRKVDPQNLLELEAMLYGTETQEAAMPSIETLIDLLRYDDVVVVVYNNDGTWTATGSAKNIMVNDDGTFLINGVSVEWLDPGTYRFLGVEGGPAMLVVLTDTDGAPYYVLSEGQSNLAIDTDGVPYFGTGVFGANLDEDTDGTPYFSYN